MSDSYAPVRNFISRHVTDRGLSINPLKITRSTIASIIRQFRSLDWNVEAETAGPNRYRLSSPDNRIELSMIGGKVWRHPTSTEQICRSKQLTKRMLEFENIPTPSGVDLSAHEEHVAQAFFEKMPKPVVVKPAAAGGSQGVSLGVTTSAEFTKAWHYALEGPRRESPVIIEEFIEGVELRAFVVGDEAVSVVARVQPYLIGSGSASVQELLELDTAARAINYRTLKMPVEVDWKFVSEQGYTANDVLENEKILLLNKYGLPPIGGLAVDISNVVDAGIIQAAIRAKNAIPGLEIAGVDLLVADLSDSSTAYVVEVNTAAALDLHRYPSHGQSRDVDIDVVQYFHRQYLESIPS